MNLRERFARWLLASIAAPEAPKRQTRINSARLAELVGRLKAEHAPRTSIDPVRREVVRYRAPEFVLPLGIAQDAEYVAQDAAIDGFVRIAHDTFAGMGFPGYPLLAELQQRSEYRSPTETISREMTRKWIKLTTTAEGDKSEKIHVIEEELKRHRVRDCFQLAAEHDGFFGRGQIGIKIKGQETDELQQVPLLIDKRTIEKGALLGFKNIEPIWTTPYVYDSLNPMAADFFKPRSWFVLGKRIHASRLLSFVSRPLPDMLKPAYNFGGLSMSQLMEPYVNRWLRTCESVNDLIHSFSLSGIMTDLSTLLQDGDATGSDDLLNRAALFNQMRDNRGLMMLNKDQEDFFQFNTPLSGLSELQAQAQEHMAAPSHIPLVKLFGITPTGLNASSEGEIRVFYDFTATCQDVLFRSPLMRVIQLIQLDRFGEIDPGIDFTFEPLAELDAVQLSAVRKNDGDRAVAYINSGVLDPEEERQRLANDPESGYNTIDPAAVPEPPEPTPPPGSEPDMLEDDPKAEGAKK